MAISNPSEIYDKADVEFALCWRPDLAAFDPYPNLKFIMAVGAGVDALLEHPGLPKHVQICRVRDPEQGQQMAAFAVHEILHVQRDFDTLSDQTRNQIWSEIPLHSPSDVNVAVLGSGSMGRFVAEACVAFGFNVCVAVRRPPTDPLTGVRYEHGPQSINAAMTDANFVVNVLPLTKETTDILNKSTLSQMRRGGWLVQIGRGEHLVEDDLMALIEAGHLRGASLDVFRHEPLPVGHPYWDHPALRITPHIASSASAKAVASQLSQTVLEMQAGLPLSLAVDRAAGY
ncbi:NAD(P)-dependent oxidoreductase [Donghicola mangrovi]|uniref:Hydroxyacid dehydrogenase n=1 Tax=Donghicola mangrovi TaxID=2729614 RepID=A0A850QI32_9RHOB|nr:NAD(P)-dependent oxidoreductase [Donghicola mangrovi]NVO25451.1 hydroxyacid dehydrogenase [Donghicola mangrovi]